MIKQHDKELSEVYSQIEIVRKAVVSSLTFISKGEEQLADMHYLNLVSAIKELNVKMNDLKRHVNDEAPNGIQK